MPSDKQPARIWPWRAVRHRDFRLYWIGSFVSLLGSQMSSLANSWQVYQLTHNALMLGLTGLFSLVPMLLFSIYGGVVADAMDRRRMMLATQVILLASSCILAAATLDGWISVSLIYGMAAIGGAVSAFNNPARTALVATLVPRDYLAGAISLRTSSRQLASVFGPSLAGIIIGSVGSPLGAHATRINPHGIGMVYIIDAVSFAAVIGALACMKTDPPAPDRSRVSFGAALEGLRFVFARPALSGAMLMDFAATFFGQSESLMPIFALEYLHVGPQGLGLLMAAPSVGSAIGAFSLATWVQVRRQGLGILCGIACYGAAWILFGFSRVFWLSWFALLITGAADALNMVLRQTMSQLLTPDELRGRMSSVNMIFSMGGPRLGEFESGVIARFFSAPQAAIVGGIGVLIVSAVIALRVPALRNYEASREG